MISSFLAAAGCGGSPESSEDGAGGTSPANSGCNNVASAELVGFEYNPPPNGKYTLKALSPGQMELVAPDTTVSSYFEWEGGDLTEHFTVGESVDVSFDFWATVSSATAFAAAHHRGELGVASDPVELPFGGPSLKLVGQCSSGSARHYYYALEATLGAEMIRVNGHETGTLGGYQIHNGGISDSTFMGESSFNESMTVLGPVAPPP